MKAVIFDRDGVIVDSEEANVLSVVETFRELGFSITEDDKRQVVAKHTDDYRAYFESKYIFNFDEFRDIQNEKYIELFADVALFPETIQFIQLAYSLHIPLALTTTSGKESTIGILRKALIPKVFDVIVTNEQYKNKKPDPESYLLTAKKLGVAPEECVVFEDSEIGVFAAKEAGMRCIAVPNRYTLDHDFSRADKVIERKELKKSLLQEFGFKI